MIQVDDTGAGIDEAFLPLAEEIFIDEKPGYYAFDAESEKLTGAEVKAKYGIG